MKQDLRRAAAAHGDMSSPVRGRLGRARRFGLPAAAAAFAVAMSLIVMPPPLYADPYHVFIAATLWPDIPADYPSIHQAMRFGLVAPTMVMQALFGEGQLAFVATSALLSAVFAVGTFLVGRSLFNDWVGTLTVGLLLITPFFTLSDAYTNAVSWATGQIMPDMPAAGLYAAGVACLVVAARRTGSTERNWLVVAGLAFGGAFLVRELIAVMYVGIPLFALILRVRLLRLVWTAVAMLACLGVDLMHNALVFGGPLARLTVASEHGGTLAEPVTLEFVLTQFDRALEWHPVGVVFYVLLAVNLLALVLVRDRRLALTLVWFLSLWIPITLAAGVLDPDSPSLRAWLFRYWTPVLPAIVIGGLGGGWLLIQRFVTPRLRSLVIVAAAAALVVAVAVPSALAFRAVERDRDWQELRDWLAAHPEVSTIVTDDRTAQTLSFYSRNKWGDVTWDGDVTTFRNRSDELPDGPGYYLRSLYGARETPRQNPEWSGVWQSSDGHLSLWRYVG